MNSTNTISGNPGNFADLSRKVDQILILLQGSTNLYPLTQESVLQSLQTIKDRLALSRSVPSQVSSNFVSSNSDASSINVGLSELKQMLNSTNINSAQIIQKLEQLCQQILPQSSNNLSQVPVQQQLNLDPNPPLLSFASTGNTWSLNDMPQMDARSTLIYNQNIADNFMNPPVSVPSLTTATPPNENQQIYNLLTEIRARLGGSNSDESITNLLNLLQRNIGGIHDSQSPEQLAQIQPRTSLTTGDVNAFKTALREIVVPSMNDTLIQTSNALISIIRDEIQNILGKYSDVNVSLNNLRTTFAQFDPASLAKRGEIQEQITQLSDKVTEFSQMLQQLHETTSQLVGQANDNTQMIFSISKKLQSIDKLQEAIDNSYILLSKNIDNRKADIDQLVYENMSLRENLQKLLEALNMIGAPSNKKR